MALLELGAALSVMRATEDSARTSPLAWSATLTVEEFLFESETLTFWTRAYCYAGCGFPGPTIEVWRPALKSCNCSRLSVDAANRGLCPARKRNAFERY